MSTINTVNSAASAAQSSSSSSPAKQTSSTGNPFLDSLKLPDESTQPKEKSQFLTQDDFFALLGQQLSMQDPFKPVDNDKMIDQMASYSTVDGINNLNTEIKNLNASMSSSQALQASGLVGRKVLIPSDTGHISAENRNLQGVVSTPQAINSISVRIEDDKGQLIKSFTVDGSAGGNIEVAWDGLNKDGQPVANGNYSIKASGKIDGKSQELPVSTYAHVESVSLGTAQTGAILNLRGVGGVKMSDVLAVSEASVTPNQNNAVDAET